MDKITASSNLIKTLENSNFNGIAWGVICILLYLSIYFLITYFKAKDRFYIFYSIYLLVNAFDIIINVKNVFFENLLNQYSTLFKHLSFPFHFLSYVFFSLFLLEVLKFNIRHPIFYKRVYKGVYLLSIVFGLLVISRYLFDAGYALRNFYFFFIMPLGVLMVAYSFTLIIKMKDSVKYFILAGMLIMITAAVATGILTYGKGAAAANKYYYILYLALLTENLLFTYALSIKQREVFIEKVRIQQKYLNKLQENEQIKSAQNKKLEEELIKKENEIVSIAKKAEQDHVAKLKSDFENEIKKLHLASLQSQMNPHFIFNALNSIKVFLIENDKEKAVYYLNKFSKLIRKILESSRVESHSLDEELEIIELYLSIENIRFEDHIHYSIDCQKNTNTSTIKVPPLILQPFVENSIWHGLMLSNREKIIKIKVYRDENMTKISLIDNGIGRKKSIEGKNKKSFKKESVGIKMTQERISYFNQKQNLSYSFEFIDLVDKNDVGIGTEVQFKFI